MKNEKRKLPEGWAKSKLSELAEYINGKAFKPEEWEKEGTPIIRIENLTDEKAPFNYYRDECKEKYKIVDGDLLVSWSATLDAFIWQRGSAYLNQHIFKVVPSENKVNNFFLYFLLRYSMKKLRENIHGATMQHITKPKFDNFEVIHPKDIEDQIRIANELERKMAEIDKMYQAALSQKEAIAAMQGAILREVFPYKEGDKLPEGWRWVKLKKISMNIQYGISKSSSPNKVGPKLLRITDIQEGKVDWSKVPYCQCNGDEEENYLLDDGDLVFTRTGATTGKSFLVESPDYALFASYLIRVQCDKTIANPNYLYSFFQSPNYWYIINQKSRGGTLAGFNATMLSELKIPLPPTLDDQITIANELERKMAETEKMRQAADNQLEAIDALPGAILRMAFDFEEEEAS
ncbi:MAG: restriction endonuclease subunit S [Methanophagales archaeon]|nr:restriction endonuclease subunit S [Methanophagales archaeon]